MYTKHITQVTLLVITFGFKHMLNDMVIHFHLKLNLYYFCYPFSIIVFKGAICKNSSCLLKKMYTNDRQRL